MTYMLSYINTRIGSEYPDKVFESLAAIEHYIAKEHPDFTSYGIVVLK